MYNDFKNLNYNQTNHKIQKIRKMVDRLYGDYEYKKHLIADLNKQLKVEINLPSEANLPDLTITNITAIDKGHYFEFTITIKNIGVIATTEETNLITTIEGEEVELTVPALDVDETVDRYTSFPYDPDAVDTYSLNVNSEVNEERNIEESDYSNNIKNQVFEIKENYIVTGVVVHVHNKEGIELNSIASQGLGTDLYSIYLDDVFLTIAVSNESEHNLYISALSGPHVLKVLSAGGNVQTKNIILAENNLLTTYFTFSRSLTSVEFYLENEGIYYYRHLTQSLAGLIYYVQGFFSVPIISFTDGDYTVDGFSEAQSNLIATTVLYDLAGTGVRG
jgi:hypothetical protein